MRNARITWRSPIKNSMFSLPVTAVERKSQIYSSKRFLQFYQTTKNQRYIVFLHFSRLCTKLENNPDDISSLFANLADNFAGVVQYNKDNRESDTKLITIGKICDIMDSGNASAVRETSSLSFFKKIQPEIFCSRSTYTPK